MWSYSVDEVKHIFLSGSGKCPKFLSTFLRKMYFGIIDTAPINALNFMKRSYNIK